MISPICKSICKKAAQKLSALLRISPYPEDKGRFLQYSDQLPIQLLPASLDALFEKIEQLGK